MDDEKTCRRTVGTVKAKRFAAVAAMLLAATTGAADLPTMGVAWYPEAWPKDRRAVDLEMMKNADITSVRIGEFNWAGFEPKEGEFRFDEFREILDLIASRGMNAVLCTPTAAPPRWLFARYPEAFKRLADGKSMDIETRRQYCVNNPDFRRRAAAVAEALAKALGGHPAVRAWQIDNELSSDAEGGHCICRHCAAGFRTWLKRKYGTLERLNAAWNGAFWSNAVQDWDQILPPFTKQIPIYWYEYSKFQSDSVIAFAHEQAEIVRRHSRRPVCYNSWGNFQCDLDLVRMVSAMDYACCDTYQMPDYPNVARAMWDLYRSFKRKPFCIGETSVWNDLNGWERAGEALRPWYWDATARGADSIYYFRWRRSVMGEEEQRALLSTDGRPSRTLARLSEIRRELRSVWDRLGDLPLPENKVAILYCPAVYQYDRSRTGFTSAPHTLEAYDTLARVYSALARLGVGVDFLPVSEPDRLARYDLLVAPRLEYLPDDFVARLAARVKEGATLFAALRLNCREESGIYRSTVTPTGLTDVLGLTVRDRLRVQLRTYTTEVEYKPPKDLPDDFMPIRAFGIDTAAYFTVEDVEAVSCEVLERFSSGELKGLPLLTRSVCGKGRAFYLAANLDPAGTEKALEPVLEAAGVRSPAHLPDAVSRVQRGDVIFYTNASPEPVRFRTSDVGDALLGEAAKDGVFAIPPYGVTVLRRNKR